MYTWLLTRCQGVCCSRPSAVLCHNTSGLHPFEGVLSPGPLSKSHTHPALHRDSKLSLGLHPSLRATAEHQGKYPQTYYGISRRKPSFTLRSPIAHKWSWRGSGRFPQVGSAGARISPNTTAPKGIGRDGIKDREQDRKRLNRKARAEKELKSVKAFLEHYQKINNSVSRTFRYLT